MQTTVSPPPAPPVVPVEAPRRRRAVHAAVVVTMAATAAYLTWRVTATLDLSVWWVSLPLLALELHAAAGLALHAFSLWEVDSQVPAAPVTATPWRVAVLIATYNEPEEVLLPTIAAAVALEPAHETWVLDDGDRPWVGELARDLGARYLTRPDHADAKAGNLNHALGHVDADLVAVLDADHAAAPDLLHHTLGYFDDPDVALVQTPQAFYNAGSFEDVAIRDRWWWPQEPRAYHEQELFYRVIQPGKNRWGAAFWCGTGALLRVAALRDVGGVATGTVTEDIQTTIRLHRRGWRTIYHNEVLAEGLAASTAEQYRLQRHRWCTGAMQVIRSERPFTAPGLRPTQRLSYAATLLGWFDAWRMLGYVLLPIVVLTTGASPIRADLATFAAAFGVTFVLQQATLYLLGRGRTAPLVASTFELVRMAPALRATTGVLFPTAVEFLVTPKGRQAAARRRPPTLLVGLLGLSVLAMGWYALTLAGATPTVYEPVGVAHAAAGWLAFDAALLAAAVTRTVAQRYAGERRAGYRFRFDSPALLDGRPCRLVDVSLTGAKVELDAAVAPGGVQGAPYDLQFAEDGSRVRCVVRSRELTDDGDVVLGVSFVEGDHADRARLALWAFRARPAAPGRRRSGRLWHRPQRPRPGRGTRHGGRRAA